MLSVGILTVLPLGAPATPDTAIQDDIPQSDNPYRGHYSTAGAPAVLPVRAPTVLPVGAPTVLPEAGGVLDEAPPCRTPP